MSKVGTLCPLGTHELYYSQPERMSYLEINCHISLSLMMFRDIQHDLKCHFHKHKICNKINEQGQTIHIYGHKC
jgi:hypothetical protein